MPKATDAYDWLETVADQHDQAAEVIATCAKEWIGIDLLPDGFYAMFGEKTVDALIQHFAVERTDSGLPR